MDKIFKYTGGFAMRVEYLSRNGEYSINMMDQNGPFKLQQNVVNMAFIEAEQAEELPKDTEFNGGCCRTGTGVSSWYEFNGKKFKAKDRRLYRKWDFVVAIRA